MEGKRLDNVSDVASLIYLITTSPIWETLQDKTQVFNNRVDSSVKSRGSHCVDVAEIAQTLSEGLGATDLVAKKAFLIGILHDIGHIPFGHTGESVADSILRKYNFSPEDRERIYTVRRKVFGNDYFEEVKSTNKNNKDNNICFEHNENSVLQYMILCREFGYEIDPEVITGILAHSTSRYRDVPPTLAEQSVRLADKLAYINYDVNDLFLTFKEGEERDALIKLYSDEPLRDPDGKEIKIRVGGKEYTMLEFVQLDAKVRIDAVVEASLEDARHYKSTDEKYKSYETFLTGCNDLSCQVASAQKKKKKAEEEKKQEEVAKWDATIKDLKRKLYERSPMMYAAYEIKERSDNFIRAGVGLSQKTQEERTRTATSSVGNQDLLNEFIYKSLVESLRKEIEENNGLSRAELEQKYAGSPVFLELYDRYMKYKEKEIKTLSSLFPDGEELSYPEIYTIVNFIGTHSNTQLYSLAAKYGLFEKFAVEVTKPLNEILDDDELYDKKTGTLKEAGRKKREKIIEEYGAKIKLDFSLEEEGLSPFASKETIKLMEEAGYLIITDYPSREEALAAINSKFKSIYDGEIRTKNPIDMKETTREQIAELTNIEVPKSIIEQSSEIDQSGGMSR